MPDQNSPTPTPGKTAAEKLANLRFPGVDVSGVPERALTQAEKIEALQAIEDAKSAKELVAKILNVAVGLGAKFLAG